MWDLKGQSTHKKLTEAFQQMKAEEPDSTIGASFAIWANVVRAVFSNYYVSAFLKAFPSIQSRSSL